MFRVPEQFRLKYHPTFGPMSAETHGNNGVFVIPIHMDTNPETRDCIYSVRTRELDSIYLMNANCIASDGGGWEHVSVTMMGISVPPPHGVMSLVKSLFWEDEDVCMHLYPKKSEYVNNHAGCLHIWRPVPSGGVPEIPTPPSIFVGTKIGEGEEAIKTALKEYLGKPKKPVVKPIRTKNIGNRKTLKR